MSNKKVNVTRSFKERVLNAGIDGVIYDFIKLSLVWLFLSYPMIAPEEIQQREGKVLIASVFKAEEIG